MFFLTFVTCLQFIAVFVQLMQQGKTATESDVLYSQRCKNKEKILNECNWCVCNHNAKFICQKRFCNEVDMFGHFQDAVKELEVGMEGHGAWRSTQTQCTPGMQYQREHLVCICDGNGNWPNPLCRDIFRVLHNVDETYKGQPVRAQKCFAGKLYLFDCNVCMCPSSERIDQQFCTKQNCTQHDPVLEQTPYIGNEIDDTTNDMDIYAECEVNRIYKFGCRKCTCQRNNRLRCDKCTTICSGTEPNELFNVGCNTCTCDVNGMVLCTTKKCLRDADRPQIEMNKSIELTLRTVNPPVDNLECIPGTKYEKDCNNTCYCTENLVGEKSYSCTLNDCGTAGLVKDITSDCVENTVYESNCLRCRCDIVDGVKIESCIVKSVCSANENRDEDLDSLHGNCKPSVTYKKDCNKCRCLSNGMTVLCSSNNCKKKLEPIVVDIIPVSQKGITSCPKDHMYKVDCNYCFCLSNGNVLCTTSECEKPKN